MSMEGRTYVFKIIIVWVKRSKRLSLSHVQGLPILRKKREQCCLNLRNDHCKSINLVFPAGRGLKMYVQAKSFKWEFRSL